MSTPKIPSHRRAFMIRKPRDRARMVTLQVRRAEQNTRQPGIHTFQLDRNLKVIATFHPRPTSHPIFVTSRADLVGKRKINGMWSVEYFPHQGAQEIARRQARGF